MSAEAGADWHTRMVQSLITRQRHIDLESSVGHELRSDPRRMGSGKFGRVLSERRPYNAPVRTFFDMEGSAMILEMDEEKRQLLLVLVSSRISEMHTEVRRCQVFSTSECLKHDLHLLQEIQEQLKTPLAHEVG